MANFDAIIFDMDGVLCDSEPFISEAAVEFFKQVHGVDVEPREFDPFIGSGEDRYLGGVAEGHGITLSLEDDKVTVYTRYLELIRGRLEPIGGVRDFIERARKQNLKLAVATSADTMKMEGNLRELKLPPESFDACIQGGDVARKKPFPDIFLLAAERMGTEPGRCLVVEDAVNGVQAAKSAGMTCLALATSFSADDLKAAGADWVSDSFTNAPDVLT